MEVHTVIETEDSFDYPLSVRVVGSYESLYLAQNAAVNRILKRAQEESSIAYAIWKDVNSNVFGWRIRPETYNNNHTQTSGKGWLV